MLAGAGVVIAVEKGALLVTVRRVPPGSASSCMVASETEIPVVEAQS